MATISDDQSPSYDQAEQADQPTDIDSVSDHRTWSFAEDEGGTTTITVSAAHLTVQRTTGPDCDGYGTDMTYSFVQRTPEHDWTNGTHVRVERDFHRTDVLADDPREAWHNYVTAELGHYLATRWLTGQPEPLH